MANHDSVQPVHPDGLFGHPRGLLTLFFTEMWERFSYYGMRAILILFMTAPVLVGGLGFGPETAGPIYAMYTSLVYLTTVPGGWLADNFLGQRKSVLLGGIIIMVGHILLALHGLVFFYSGLACVVLGTGLLKPNISVIVGQLYSSDDKRRDSGFSIFYMGINLGAFCSPLVCGWLAQSETFREMLEGWGIDPNNAWHFGFGAAAVGMFFGLLQYVITGKNLGEAGLRPTPAPTPAAAVARRRTLKIGIGATVATVSGLAALAILAPGALTKDTITAGFAVVLLGTVVLFFGKLFLFGNWTPSERARLRVIFVLFCGAAIFWGVFEQAGSTLTLFADRSTENSVLGFSFPSSWWQSVNALLIILLTPFFAWLWIALRRHNPSYPAKFGVGLLLVGLGFIVLVGGASSAGAPDAEGITTRVTPLWLFSVYSLHTVGELCLSPVGLSSMTKLAPARIAGLMMGVWFLAAAVGNFLGGTVAGYYEDFSLPLLLGVVGGSAVFFSVIMFALVGPIKRMLARSKEEEAAAAPAD